MILATTESIACREAIECLGIATAEGMAAPNSSQYFAMTGEKIMQVRQDLLFEAREQALQRLADIATARGGDAVVGVRLDYEIIEPTYHVLLASAVGTVVKLAPPGDAK